MRTRCEVRARDPCASSIAYVSAVHDPRSEDKSVVFFALSGGDGNGFTQLYPSFSSLSMRRLWILNDLFVAATARKQGVGAALLERAKQFAVETNAKGLVLETVADNPARKLYETNGMRRGMKRFITF